MNLPNRLTVARCVLTIVFVGLFLTREPWGAWAALAVFCVAAVTDWLDGLLARRSGDITRLGEFLDPLADKLLVTAGLVLCVEVARAPSWMVIVILARDYAVTGLRIALIEAGRRTPATAMGKWKTLVQMGYLLGALTAEALLAGGHSYPVLDWSLDVLLWCALVWTVISGIDVFRRGGGVLKGLPQ